MNDNKTLYKEAFYYWLAIIIIMLESLFNNNFLFISNIIDNLKYSMIRIQLLLEKPKNYLGF